MRRLAAAVRFMVAVTGMMVVVTAGLGCARGPGGGNPRQARILYETSGGLVGASKRIEMAGSGEVVVTSEGPGGNKRQVIKVAPTKVTALVSVMEKQGFFSMQERYAPQQPVPDSLSERLKYTDGARTKAVTVITGVRAPEGWDVIIKEITALASGNS